MSNDFREEVKLDKYELDTCALNQPELFAKWGKEWADAVDTRDKLKDKLSLVRSECDQEIRLTPSEFGWEKPDKSPTEAFISSAIITHPAYVEANEEFQEAQHQVNVMVIAKDSFEQRSKMIGVLTELYKSGYYSGNKKLDHTYLEVLPKEAAKAQNEALASSPRLARRKLSGD